MKNLIILVTILMVMPCLAQKSYLKIYQGNALESQTSYPPGTKFELRNSNDQIVNTEETLKGEFKISSPHTLVVSPDYKDGTDIYNLKHGMKITQISYGHPDKRIGYEGSGESRSDNYISNGVYATTEITDSEKVKGMKNLLIELSNGITFSYFDGQVEATYQGKTTEIKGKYVIRTDVGAAKIAFNPKNGSLWWVFDDQDGN